MSDINLDKIPHTPHFETLQQLSELAWRNDMVTAIWIGGSIAAGNSDVFSDIDFRISVKQSDLHLWKTPNWNKLLPVPQVGSTYIEFGRQAKLHHMLLKNGVLVDYYIQCEEKVNKESQVVTIAARSKDLKEHIESFSGQNHSVYIDVEPHDVRQLIVDYWITSHKHLKAMSRNQGLMTIFGLYHERVALMRAMYILESGKDLGSRPTIHAMSNMISSISDNDTGPWEVMGHQSDSITEAARSIELIREKMGSVGRALATRYSFEYPYDLERVVLASWRNSAFCIKQGG